MRGEKEHNEGVPLSILAVLPFHHLLKERDPEEILVWERDGDVGI